MFGSIEGEVVPRSLGVVGQAKMIYTYILQSIKDGSFYVGLTSNLKRRFEEHNRNKARYSSLKSSFQLVWYAAFGNKQTAQEFEKYLKSSSGFAFRNKRLL